MLGVAAVTAIRQTTVAAAHALEPGVLSLDDAKQMLRDVTASKNSLATMQALLAKRVADTGEWKRDGDRSPEEHLAKETGTSVGRAKETLGTAERLGGLGATDEAARAGELSPEQAAAVSDAATANPAAEQKLLATAKKGSLKELEDECAKVKAAADADPDETHLRIHEDRSLRIWADRTGVAKLFGQTTVEQMAIIKAAVEQRTDELFNAARREGRSEPRAAYAMDALAQICAEWMGQPAPPTEAEPTDAEPAKTSRPKPPAFLGIIRVDLEALRRGWVEGDEVCEIAGLGPVPVEQARRLLGAAILYLVLTKGSAVGTTVNVKRGPNTAQRIALLATQPTCDITGCTSPFSEADHEDPWAACKVTELGNLKRKCTHHHDLKTKGWATLEEAGVVFMVAPDDSRHPRNAHAPPDTS